MLHIYFDKNYILLSGSIHIFPLGILLVTAIELFDLLLTFFAFIAFVLTFKDANNNIITPVIFNTLFTLYHSLNIRLFDACKDYLAKIIHCLHILYHFIFKK